MNQNIVGRNLSVHKEHELLLKLEQAGLKERIAQLIIESKENALAHRIVNGFFNGEIFKASLNIIQPMGSTTVSEFEVFSFKGWLAENAPLWIEFKFFKDSEFIQNFMYTDSKIPECAIQYYNLQQAAYHPVIIAALGGSSAAVRMAHVCELMLRQPRGNEDGALNTSGTLVPVHDAYGYLRLLQLRYDYRNKQWDIVVHKPEDLIEFREGMRVLKAKPDLGWRHLSE